MPVRYNGQMTQICRAYLICVTAHVLQTVTEALICVITQPRWRPTSCHWGRGIKWQEERCFKQLHAISIKNTVHDQVYNLLSEKYFSFSLNRNSQCYKNIVIMIMAIIIIITRHNHKKNGRSWYIYIYLYSYHGCMLCWWNECVYWIYAKYPKFSFLRQLVLCFLTLFTWSVDKHYSDVIMGGTASQIASLTIVYSSVYSGADQRKHQSPSDAGNSPVTGELPSQMASNAENVSNGWRRHAGTLLVEITRFRLLYAKPLPEPTLTYRQSMIWLDSKYNNIFSG